MPDEATRPAATPPPAATAPPDRLTQIAARHFKGEYAPGFDSDDSPLDPSRDIEWLLIELARLLRGLARVQDALKATQAEYTSRAPNYEPTEAEYAQYVERMQRAGAQQASLSGLASAR